MKTLLVESLSYYLKNISVSSSDTPLKFKDIKLLRSTYLQLCFIPFIEKVTRLLDFNRRSRAKRHYQMWKHAIFSSCQYSRDDIYEPLRWKNAKGLIEELKGALKFKVTSFY